MQHPWNWQLFLAVIGAWALVSVLGFIVVKLILYFGKKLDGPIKRWLEPRKPIVCVTENCGVTAVCLRRDYDRASRTYWRRAGSSPPGKPVAIPVHPSFSMWGSAMDEVLAGCRVERAVFRISVEDTEQTHPDNIRAYFFSGMRRSDWRR